MFKDGKIYTGTTMDRIAPGPLGVRTYDKAKCFNGYTLFSSAFGYTEWLIDMNGMVVHTWPCQHSQLAELLPNGNLMVDDYGSGLHELAPDGTELWSWKGPYHHDFYCLPNGNIVMLTNKTEPVKEGYYAEGFAPKEMLTDVVIEIDRKGNTLWEFSFSDHIEELHELAGLPKPVRYVFRGPDGTEREGGNRDWAHTNTIEVLPDTPLGQRDKRFRAGNLLFSFRSLDIIGVIDRDAEAIVWAWGLGVLDGQHQPTMIPNGNILIFDNGTYRNNSAAVEMNPETGKVVWQFDDGPNFYSPFRSGVQRLPNGNTMICSSDEGRIFEVTPGKEIVWDFWSPFLGQGKANQGRHIYRATRCTEDYIEPIIASRTEKITAVANENHQKQETFRDVLKYYSEGFAGK
ncbi:MAG: hypothetical protein GXP25_25445 [Planctomycetes bacterium]|nr:hypothetical protein [Planctomycetota bacterium]